MTNILWGICHMLYALPLPDIVIIDTSFVCTQYLQKESEIDWMREKLHKRQQGMFRRLSVWCLIFGSLLSFASHHAQYLQTLTVYIVKKDSDERVRVGLGVAISIDFSNCFRLFNTYTHTQKNIYWEGEHTGWEVIVLR
jgi:hypothetical protein